MGVLWLGGRIECRGRVKVPRKESSLVKPFEEQVNVSDIGGGSDPYNLPFSNRLQLMWKQQRRLYFGEEDSGGWK